MSSRKTKKTYSLADYSSNDGFLTTNFGPALWHTLHTISFNYKVNPTYEDKIHYRNFVLSLLFVTPCGKCRENLKKNFQKLPLTMNHMKNRTTFSKYIYNLHELINTMLGKKSNLTYNQVRDRYEQFRARCSSKKNITRRKSEEAGCTNPLYGRKTKCVIKIVDADDNCPSFEVN